MSSASGASGRKASPLGSWQGEAGSCSHIHQSLFPVAALDLVGGGRGAPHEAVGEAAGRHAGTLAAGRARRQAARQFP